MVAERCGGYEDAPPTSRLPGCSRSREASCSSDGNLAAPRSSSSLSWKTPGGDQRDSSGALLSIPVRLKSEFGERTNVFRGVCEREAGLCRGIRKRPFLEDLSSTSGRCAGRLANCMEGHYCPPFAIQFGRARATSHLLAVADEDGYVTVTDTSGELPKDDVAEDYRPKARWAAHNNSIFDLTWSHQDEVMTTVGGDETVKIWSTETQRELLTLSGHSASIKSVAFKHDNQNILASGGRDGRLMLWDLRDSLRCQRSRLSSLGGLLVPAIHKPVKTIHNAHLKSNSKRNVSYRSSSARRKTIKTSPQSVTGVLFLKADNVLASSGSDGKVKFWDVRKLSRPTHLITLPQAPGLFRDYGVPSIAQDASGSRLAVTSFNDSVYLYDCVRPEIGPVGTCKGLEVTSFYIKLAFSPDGTHLLSGSSDGNAYIWQVDRPEDGGYVLKGHSGEVSGVSWCPTDFCKVATCSDDSYTRVWNIDRHADSPRHRKIAMPPTVTLHHSVRSLNGKHNYMDQVVETSAKDKAVGTFASKTYVDCSRAVRENDAGRRVKHPRTQQYRNVTLEEVWGVKKG
ncbi:WD40 repeat domain-containing protein [Chloropicon primus]|uniref:WD40 repeat domain-containing protein n=1 Tax=Chloropicon primus TaxID=1764295 RepID=A0A5B8MNC2_9CHLO|nr:WD40 repeat domain-containing protein [Chloropicon primus]UPR01118.1 WD40 repeat domain-containing protein [Chloropicon primus]|eukprot:QDZ21897.1 WD40 repeat domain-containing protein [Chloropicon primus]